MKKHILIWTILLLLPSFVFANPSFLRIEDFDGSTPCANWTGNGECTGGMLSIPAKVMKFIHGNINQSTSTGNWSINITGAILSTNADDFFISLSKTAICTYPNGRHFEIRENGGVFRFSATDSGNYDVIEGLKADGTNQSIQIVMQPNKYVAVFLNGTQVTASIQSYLGYEVTDFCIGLTDTNTVRANVSIVVIVNGTSYNLTEAPQAPDTTPPEITYYNLTNDNGCESWNTDKNTACGTSSVTPTIQFNTSENAWCAIVGSSSSTSLNINYTEMGSSRNCTGVASGEGGTLNHRCTLTPQDELVYDTSYLYISCKDASNNQNRTSTSGALKLSITGLEAAGRNSIGIGVQNALLSSYTNYTDLQIYARNLSNAQVKGTFDRAAKKGSKMWAFNRIGVSDSYVNMFNLTPVLYTLELANKTSSNITLQVEQLINATK